MTAYYNEFDPYAAQWLRNLIDAEHISKGEVDERSITEVQPDDIKGFTQCHFFAGIGGWSLAARLAGWPDDRELWTGSAPCQPFSTAGNQKGQKDERHLWPKFFELISACRPATIMGEQVSAAIRFGWLDGVSADLESEGYTTGSVIIPACAVNAPHRRDRLWFVGYTEHDGQHGTSVRGCDAQAIQHDAKGQNLTEQSTGAGSSRNVSSIIMADTNGKRGNWHGSCSKQTRRNVVAFNGSGALANTDNTRSQGHGRPFGQHDAQGRKEPAGYSAKNSFWHGAEYLSGPDGKSRRIEPRIRLLAHGIPARSHKLRALGNAIVPQVAAEVIKAYMECRP